MDWAQRWEVALGERAWAAAWRALPRRQRRRIAAAIERGEALEELDEAAIALGTARDRKRELERPLWGGGSGRDSLVWIQYDNAEQANLRMLQEAWAADRPTEGRPPEVGPWAGM